MFLFTFLMALAVLPAGAQPPLDTDGEPHLIEFDAGFQDFLIPEDTSITQIVLRAKGGDGGIARVERESCTSPAGAGATLTVTINIGQGPDQIPWGSRLRFIVGGRGEDGITRSDFLGTGFAYGGGGGGTGILFETPDTAIWQMLAVAGGGGGAYVGRAVGFCVNNREPAAGQGGLDWIAGGDGKGGFFGGRGGTFGDGGAGSEFAGGGGGFLTTGGGVTCIEFEFPLTTYQAGAGQKGYPEGGIGGMRDDCIGVLRIHEGGFGFGGGGAGWGAGGGGGGYSGGGAGATTGGGGGGGSFVNAIASSRTIAAGAATREPKDGYIEYQVVRKAADAPVAQCKEVNISLDNAGLAILDPAAMDNGSSDANGGALTFTLSRDTFNCSDLGESILTLTVANETGLSGQCDAKVTIRDTQSPTLSCPEDIKIDHAPGECGANVDFADLVSANDNCTALLSYSHPPGARFDTGETEVMVTATDAAGNETACTFTVKVTDTEAPQITCPADLSLDCTQWADLPDLAGEAIATDNCEGVVITSADTQIPLTCEGIYSITRTWTATDAAGNTTFCTQQLTRLPDTVAPECLDCPADITVSCENIPAAPATLNLTDNCDESPVFSLHEETVEDGGEGCERYTVIRTFTVSDRCGNSREYVQRIKVEDREAPVCLDCPSDITVSCDAVPAAPAALNITDNCDAATSFAVQQGITEAADGACSANNYTLIRRFIVTDACGNTREYLQRITVRDLTPPVITCPADVDVSCTATIDPEATGTPTFTDNCGVATLLGYEDVLTGDCRSACTIERTWTVVDPCGNTSQCVQTIVQSSREIIQEALSQDLDLDGVSDPIVLGFSNRTLTIGPEAADCIAGWLPHAGGSGLPMPRGQYVVDPADCLPGPNELTEDGRLRNRLLAEILILSIKLRLDPELANLPYRELDCQFSPMVRQALRPYSTVSSILRLGNITLANLYGPFYEPVASAIQCINNQYPLCADDGEAAAVIAQGIGLKNESMQTGETTAVQLYPNPVGEELFIHAPGLEGQPAVLRIYTLQGQMVAEERIGNWPSASWRVDVAPGWRGMYLLQILVEGQTVRTERFVVDGR